jgi:hypothetical protein
MARCFRRIEKEDFSTESGARSNTLRWQITIDGNFKRDEDDDGDGVDRFEPSQRGNLVIGCDIRFEKVYEDGD